MGTSPAEPTPRIVRLAVRRNEPTALSRVRSAVRATALENGLSHDSAFDLAVAATEAVGNALTHADMNGGGIDVTLVPGSDGVEVEVLGPGPFRISNGLDPERGRGLPLMVALSDEVQFASEGGRTRVRLRKRA